MEDAVVALQSAIDELRMAKDALPGELGGEVQAIIQHAQTVLDAVRAKIQAGSG